MVGEAWSVIAGKGSAFDDPSNPQVVVKVGATNSQGIVEITDIIFSTIGPGVYDLWLSLPRAYRVLISWGCYRCRVECERNVPRWGWYVGFTYQVSCVFFI